MADRNDMDDNTITLTFKDIHGKEDAYTQIPLSTTIEELMEAYKDDCSEHDEGVQKFYYEGKVLDGQKTIQECGLQHEAVVLVVLRVYMDPSSREAGADAQSKAELAQCASIPDAIIRN